MRILFGLLDAFFNMLVPSVIEICKVKEQDLTCKEKTTDSVVCFFSSSCFFMLLYEFVVRKRKGNSERRGEVE